MEYIFLSEYSLAGRPKSSMGNAKYQREIKSIFAMDRTISQQIYTFLKFTKGTTATPFSQMNY